MAWLSFLPAAALPTLGQTAQISGQFTDPQGAAVFVSSRSLCREMMMPATGTSNAPE
jgi:hypothetical protein